MTRAATAVGTSMTVLLIGVAHLNAQTTPGNTQTTPQATIVDVDQLFVIEAAQGGMAEVRMAQLALKQSNDNAVKQYAQQMITDHTALNNQLMQVARSQGLTPPAGLGKYQVLLNQLAQLSGSAFDQVYRNEAGVNSHLENLAVFRRQAMVGRNPQLKALAASSVPTIQNHLQMGLQLSGQTLNSSQGMTPKQSVTPRQGMSR